MLLRIGFQVDDSTVLEGAEYLPAGCKYLPLANGRRLELEAAESGMPGSYYVLLDKGLLEIHSPGLFLNSEVSEKVKTTYALLLEDHHGRFVAGKYETRTNDIFVRGEFVRHGDVQFELILVVDDANNLPALLAFRTEILGCQVKPKIPYGVLEAAEPASTGTYGG